MVSTETLTIVNIVLNVLLCVGAILLTHLLTSLRETVNQLRSADQTLSGQISAIQVLVAGQYITRQEFRTEVDKLGEALFRKLDRMEDRHSKKDHE